MPYSVNNTDSSLNFTVQDGAVDTSTLSVSLIGTNSENYGDDIARNDIHLLENFASISKPSAGTILTGQIWYDKTDNVLRVYKGNDVNDWVNIETLVSATAPTRLTARLGEKYFDTSNNKGYIFDGAQWRPTGYAGEETSAFSGDTLVHNPTKFGSKVRAIFLKDTSGRVHPCLGLVYVNNSTTNELYGSSTNGETLMAIFNHDAQFTADNVVSTTEGDSINYYAELNATGGIGVVINKGMNLRDDYVSEAVALATEAVTAQKANALVVGGDVIASSNFYKSTASLIPGADITHTLGSPTNRFDHLYIQQITLGAGQEQLQFVSDNNAKIGSSSKRAKEIYTYDLFATDDVTVGDTLSVTGLSNLTGNVDVVNNLQVNQNIRGNAFVRAATFQHNAHDFTINSGAITGAQDITSNGTITFGSISDGSITITAFVDEDGMTSDSASLVPTQQSTKAYVDTEVATLKTYVQAQDNAQDLDFAGDSGTGATVIGGTVDSATMTFTGGDGITTSASGTTLTTIVDSTVARTNANETFDANVTITGNLIVNGTQTTVNSETLTVNDNIIVLNNDATGSATANAGIEVERGDDTNVQLRWNESTTKWQFTNDGSTYSDITTFTNFSVTSGSASGNGSLTYNNGTGAFTFTPADTSLSTKSTTNLSEGSNLYYTDVRADARIGLANLSDLNNVATTTPSSNQVLQWNGAAWAPATTAAGVTDLNDLGDVFTGGATTGQVLQRAANGNFNFGSVSTTNNYVSGLSFNTGDGILTATRSGLGDLTVDLDGRYATTNTTYSAATSSALGLIKIGYTDNGKNYAVELDGDNEAFVNVPWTDTAYSLPLAASGTRGGVKIGYVENGKNYPVELSSEKMFVNVPWSDSNDNTVYTAGSGITKNTAGSSAGAFSHEDTSSVTNLSATSRTYISGMTFDTYGHVTGYTTGVEENQTFSDTNYYLSGASFNTGNGVLTLTRSGLSSVTVDLDGRFLTGITSSQVTTALGYTPPSSDTNTTYTAGNGLTLSGTQFLMSGSYAGTFTASGDVVAFSDEKLKDNIQTLDGSKVFDMRGVSFNRNDQDSKLSSGVIAQELEDIAPELIHESEDGTKGVAYGNTVGYLIEAIKLLKAEVDDLKRQLNEK